MGTTALNRGSNVDIRVVLDIRIVLIIATTQGRGCCNGCIIAASRELGGWGRRNVRVQLHYFSPASDDETRWRSDCTNATSAMLALLWICMTKCAKGSHARPDATCRTHQHTHATLARATGQSWHDQSRGRQRSSANSNGAALMHLKSCSMASDEALLAAEAAAIGGSDAQPSPSRVRLMLTIMGSAKPRALAPKPPS